MAATEEITGKLAAIIWQADDGSAVIARLDNGRVVKGPCEDGGIRPGLSYRFHGRTERHDKYGEQFVFATYSKLVPADKRGVLAYLVSTAENVGEKTALRLWERFGPGAVEMLRQWPEEVVAAGIMTTDAATRASLSLHDESAFETVKVDLLGLFAGRGFQSGKVIKACIQRWGAKAPLMVRRNPYLLMLRKVPSCGFKRCDKLYCDLGLPQGKLKRQAIVAWHHLRSSTDGHTWHAAESVCQAVVDAVPSGDPVRALRLGIRAKLLVRRKAGDSVWIAEAGKASNEETVAKEIGALLRRPEKRRRLILPLPPVPLEG